MNSNPLVRARCCNMIGNIMRHNGLFYDTIKKNKEIFSCLARCCQSDELNVRKVMKVRFILN